MQFGCDMRSITLRGTPVSILLSAITLVMAPPSRTDSANRSDVVVADSSDVVPAPEARQSPVAIAATTLDDGTHLKVVYSSPRKRDRRIFGALVPFGEVWRTGANEATEITATRDVLLAGHLVPAGTYAIFTVPQPDTWTIILNGVLGQWGKYEYDPAEDVLRFDVETVDQGRMYEAFTIEFEDETGDVSLVLSWDRVSVTIPVAGSGR